MSQIIPIYIPTFISDATYSPSRVLPHIYFYNGLIDCEEWWLESGSLTTSGVSYSQTRFPYFDNYNVISGSQFPTTDSLSLLFNNENASYGEVPIDSLYTTYWEKYIQFLYNPKTRVLNCQAIIPLADYFQIELNDIVNFRGNYWHLRAINDYSLKTGECNLQLLGPIISDVFDVVPPPPPAQASSSVSWSYSESAQDGTFIIYDNASTIATLTANGGGNSQISESHTITATLVPVSYPSSGSVTMSINVNGDATTSSIAYTNTTISASFLVGSAQNYTITGSIVWNAPPPFTIEYLVVAGGGGGGTGTSGNPSTYGGGGGAGGFRTGSATLTSPGSLNAVVGAGGTSTLNGNNSSFNGLTSTAGGAGGSGFGDAGNNGGSGGGGSTTGAGGSGTAGQGNNGSAGSYINPSQYYGGAGGGAGGAANNAQAGAQKAWLDGNNYAGGGNGPNGSGGASTSGSGGNGIETGTAGSGKNGIVKIRYAGSGSRATGGIITYDTGYTYHTFISDGTFSY